MDFVARQTTEAHRRHSAPNHAAIVELSREFGLRILMGAPNLVRGKSHSGNVSAGDLAACRLLDILSSDYVPSSLLQAAFKLAGNADEALPEAVALVSRNPALRRPRRSRQDRPGTAGRSRPCSPRRRHAGSARRVARGSAGERVL